MDLNETLQMGLRPEKTKSCTFPAKSRYGVRTKREKWVADALFFCQVNLAPLLPLSFDRYPPNFPRTRVQVEVVARYAWFHISENFPLRGRIYRKTVLGYFRVPCLCSA